MIHRIFSDLPSFKELQFRPGLNVLVAEKSPGATDKQTRNGAGKTSLIEIIHFLTGAKTDGKGLLRNEALMRGAPRAFAGPRGRSSHRSALRRR